MSSTHGRAKTEAQKRDIVERLLAAWLRAPKMRLGQLLDNAVRGEDPNGCGMFFTEDERLAEVAERFAEKR